MSMRDPFQKFSMRPAAGTRKVRSFLDFVTSTSDTADHTDAFILAAAASAAEGFDVEIPGGTWNYSASIPGWARSIRGAGRSVCKVFYRLDPTVAGNNCLFADMSSASDIEISGIDFSVPLTPTGAVNDATENKAILRLTNCANAHVVGVDFRNSYGTAVLMRGVAMGSIRRSRTFNSRKDSFHITGLSRDIQRVGCLVEAGGDDAFPVVGYASGGTVGRPVNITDIANVVRGLRTGRGFAYVGSSGCINIDGRVDGTTPAGYSTTATQHAYAGLYIASESSFDTFGNDDLTIIGMNIANCGSSDSSLNSIHIIGRSAQTSRNITLRDVTVSRSARMGLFANGGSGLENLRLEGITIDDNTDLNARIGTAGAGSASGIEVQATDGVFIRGNLKNIGGYGVMVTANCTGNIDVDVATSEVNKSGTAGNDIVQVAAGSQAREISISLDIKAQTANIDRIIECVNPGKVRKLKVTGVQFDRRVITGTSGGMEQTITVGASPFVYENTGNQARIVRVTGGTVSSIEAAAFTGIATPYWGTLTSRTAGLFTVEPGCALRVNYSSAPSMSWNPTSC